MKYASFSLALGFALLTIAIPRAAQADGKQFDVGNAAYREECGGSCHIAYPPQLLPAASWRALMTTLDRHFGTDASFEPGPAAAVADFLVSRSGRRETRTADGSPVLRISETGWFRREHDETPSAVWKRPDVNSAANCGACHRNAGAGDYRERSLHVPRSAP
jgi:hypothetical protein